VIRVVAAIIERDGRLLVCQRRAGGVFGLKWEFPGGKLRPSETPREGLARELHEELGINSEIGREVWRVSHRYEQLAQGVSISFFGARLSGWPRNLVFEQTRWVWRGELPRYDFLAADRVLCRGLVRGEFTANGRF